MPAHSFSDSSACLLTGAKKAHSAAYQAAQHPLERVYFARNREVGGNQMPP